MMIPPVDNKARKGLNVLTTDLGYSKREITLTDALIDRVFQIPSDSVTLIKPTQLTSTLPTGFNIYKKGNLYYTDYDVSVLKNPEGVIYYVSPTLGSDSNDGLTSAAPLKFIKTAHDKADVGTIKLMAGDYFFRDNVQAADANFVISKNINLIAVTKRAVRIIAGAKTTWTKTADKTNTYEHTFSSIASFKGVADLTNLDANDEPIRFTAVASLALCDSTPNSTFNSGNTMYIHTFDSREPQTTEIAVYSDAFIPCYVATADDFNIYVEGIEFFGGYQALHVEANKVGHASNFIAKDCKFINAFSPSTNTMTMLGGNYFFQNCVCAKSKEADGFNYHKSTVTNEIGLAIEINCVGRDNGDGTIDNGSTIHDGYEIVRLNCAYWGNGSPNMADTSNGSVAWCVGCICAESINGYDIKAYDNAVMILEGHVIVDPAKIVEAAPDSNPEGDTGTIIYSNCRTKVSKISSSPSVYRYQ